MIYEKDLQVKQSLTEMVGTFKVHEKEVEKFLDLYKKIYNYHKSLGGYTDIIRKLSENTKPEDILQDSKMYFWRNIVNTSKVQDLMSSSVREEFQKQLQEAKKLEINEENILNIFQSVLANSEKYFKTSAVDVFNYITRYSKENMKEYGWKTNKFYMINRKVILPLVEFSFEHFNLRYHHIDVLNDIEKILSRLSGKSQYLRITTAINDTCKKIGYTQPIVTIFDENINKYVIIDGFHRYFTAKTNKDILERNNGYVPIVVLKKNINERMSATVRHNRARGSHSIKGMSNIVFEMLDNGASDEDVCNNLGMEPEELLKLKHLTGFSKLFQDVEYNKAWVTKNQILLSQKIKQESIDK